MAEIQLQNIGQLPQKHAGGRPTVVTDEVVRKLVAAFQRGYNDTIACEYAKISRDAFYDRLRVNTEFSDTIADAKNYWVLLAGEHITDLLRDRTDKHKALKIDTARWIYEKRMRDTYGSIAIKIGNETQNNYYNLTKDEIRAFANHPEISNTSPTELFKALEGELVVDTGGEKGSAPPIHRDEVQNTDTITKDMPQPQPAV